jgi:hypothetical protein
MQELKVHHHVTLRSHQMTKLGEVPPLISYGSQTFKECCKGVDEY